MSSYAMRLEPSIDMERSDPVVTYKRVDPAEGQSRRQEPRLSARGREDVRLDARDVTDINVMPEVDAPASAEPIDVDGLFDDVAPVRGKKGRAPRRRRGGLGFTVGAAALLLGGGVLAYTFLGVTRPADSVAPVLSQPAATASLEAAPALDVEPAASNVRVISTDNPNAGAAVSSDGGTAVAALPSAAAFDGAAGGLVAPPMPRLRPATAAFPQTGVQGAPAGFGPVPAADTGFSGVIPPAPDALPADPDLDRALATVDQILDGRQGSVAPQQLPPAGAMPAAGAQPQVLAPQGQQFPVQGQQYPAQTQQQYPAQQGQYPEQGQYPASTYSQGQYPANAYPDQQVYGGAPAGGDYYGPPAPPPDYYGQQNTVQQAPAGSFGADWLPQRRVYVPENAPVPPADVPGGVY